MTTKPVRNSLRFRRIRIAASPAIVCIGLVVAIISRSQAENEASGAAETWGTPAEGLQARAIAVQRSADEQKPIIPTTLEKPKFFRAEEATFVVEVKNVGDKPISLQGTRYGKNVSPPWPGKSASNEFAPHLFTCEFFGADGKPIEGALHEMQGGDNMMSVSSGSAEMIEPGKSLVMLIRPLSWDASLARRFEPGDFKIRVHYHGPGAKALEAVVKTWPDSQLKGAWTGDVATGEATFTIASVPENKAPEPVWGQPVDGLRAAVEFASSMQSFQAIRDTSSATFPHGSQLVVHSLIQNASDHDIKFWSETWRQDDKVVLIDDSGKETDLRKAWFSGWARMEHWTLKPGEVAVLAAMNLQIAADGKAGKDSGLPTIVGPPGKYRVRYDLRFGGMQRLDKDGKVVIPGEGDWQGNLSTGVAAITVRQRRPEDDPVKFTARLELKRPDGKPIESGEIDVKEFPSGNPLLKAELKSGAVEIPNCTAQAVTAYVRTPGFEETRFWDIAVDAEQIASVTLKPAEPAKFRLLGPDGKPFCSVSVRLFNTNKTKASAGPYPVDGLKGPIWAASNPDGVVVLDTLQKFDPLDVETLGENMYWFYVEPLALAPRFVGPIEAGQDLGDLAIGPLLTVSGEVHGTPEELRAFQAEWDQPEPMKRGDGTIGWHYAESKPLVAQQAGDKLTFKLSDLRPGTLRIVSRFARTQSPISHTYTRREPTEDDVVFEVNLTESRNDLVVENKKANK